MRLFILALTMIFTGFLLLFVAPFLSLAGRVEVAGGGCIVLFFIPFCFGAGSPQLLSIAVVMSAVLAVIAALIMWLTARELARRGGETGE